MTVKLEKSHRVAWDDPRAWGFCSRCAYMEPVDVITGFLLDHQEGCMAGGLVPMPDPETPEVWPTVKIGWKHVKVDLVPEAAHGIEPE